jgi:hypothetical protein
MINNNTISRIYILTNPVLINDTTGFYACLQFDKAGFQKLLLARKRPCTEPEVIACGCATGTFCTTPIVVLQNVVQ